MKKYQILIPLIAGLALLNSCSCSQKQSAPSVSINEAPAKAEILRHKIDGQPKVNDQDADLYPVAVMIENSVDAWPLSGLDKANIVFEAITEASIPRFVVIFANDKEIKKIGPVRSARPYFLDFIEPWQPLYLHVGGSPEALQKARSDKYDLIDLDQFFNAKYFWRDTKWRYAPHNVYTSSELLTEVLTAKNLLQPVNYQTWTYKEDKKLEERPENVKDIVVNYNHNYYKVNWQYNREENNYLRYQGDKLVKMSDGEWIKAKNVIVQVNNMQIIDDLGRKKIDTLGEGQAWVFRDGEMIEGRWKKESIDQMIKYYNKDNQDIELNGGPIWIEVIPDADYLEY